MSMPFSKTCRRVPVPRQPDQRGFTLIELMIAMVVSSLLVGFVFAIQTRMSLAYRSQSSVSEVQQVVRMAKDLIVRDVRAAGYLMPHGFRVSTTISGSASPLASDPMSPIIVQNDPDGLGPDSIHLFYADPTAFTEIMGSTTSSTDAQVSNDSIFYDAMGFFQPGLAVIVEPPKPSESEYSKACVVMLTGAAPGTLFFDTSGAPYNTATNGHCEFGSSIIAPGSMIYRLIAHAYRIDPARMDAGVLQISRSGMLAELGGLASDWSDIGFGFTDLQIARRYHEDTDSNGDVDLDGSAKDDWYSGTVAPPATAELVDVNVSIVARTFREVNGVATKATPDLRDPTNIHHNQLGDEPSFVLAGVPDASRPIQHRGNHVYRWVSVRIDIRNPLGPGL